MNKWLNRAANLFLLLLCAESLLGLMQESFRLTVRPGTYGWLALLCAALWVMFFLRRGFLPWIAAAAGVWWVQLRYGGEDLRLELRDFFQAVREFFRGGFLSGDAGPALPASAESHSLLLLLLLFLAAVYLAMVLSGESFRINLSLLLTVPLVALCLLVKRDAPPLPLLGMGLFWAGLFVSGDSYRPQDAAGRAVLLTLLPCLAVLGITLLFHNPESYVPDDRAAELTRRLEEWGDALSNFWDDRRSIPRVLRSLGRRGDARSGWDRGQDGLDLTQPYDFSVWSNELFTLRSSADGGLYLRGRSLGAYTGTGWLEAEEQTGFQALNYAAASVAMADYTGVGAVTACSFEIEGDRAFDTLYLPYYTITDLSGDVSVPAGGRTAYGGQNLLLTGGRFGPLPDSLRQEELQYRAFVREYYTRLPDQTRRALLEISRDNGLSPADGDILAKIADFVRRGSIYDLGVGPYPGDDYAVYFLQSARRGYCIHYATAACCLYRALGFPARLCEGFLVTAHPGGETAVRAGDAHAWVEVWLDGVGWVPIEVTVGDSAGDGDPGDAPGYESGPDREDALPGPDTQAGEPEADSAPGQAETAADSGESAPDADPPAEDAGGAPDPGRGEIETDDTGERPPGEGAADGQDDPSPAPVPKERSLTDKILPWVFGLLAAVVLAVIGRYVLVRRRLRRWLAEPDGRLRAVCLYRQARRVLRYGGEMPEAVLTAAEKASFSPHSIREEELDRSRAALNALTDQVQHALRPLRRLLFRYDLGL